ncbi:MAG: glycosyltransferase [Ruminococcus sp.]|nr:glycosyltransferase [Ruminococcus sp.]
MKVLILLTDTGGGHHRASLALKDTIEKDPNNEVMIEDALMYSSKFIHFVVTRLYMFFATKTPKLYGKIYNSADKVSIIDKAVHGIASFYSRKLSRLITQFKPDCIISCHAFCSEMVSNIKKKGKSDALLFNIITDYAAHAAYINDNVDAYIVANDDMVQQLREQYGVDGTIIYPLGIPIYETFYRKEDPTVMREKLGLNPYKKTVLMMAGSFGVANILDIYKNLNKNPGGYQLVVVTGKNENLFSEFQTIVKNGFIPSKKGNNIKVKIPTKLCYFVDNIEDYMSAGDVIVTKPGGLTVSESMAKEIPMAIFRSYDGQEKDNAEYLQRHNLAIILKEGKEGAKQLNALISDDNALETMRNNIKTFRKNNSSQNIYRLINEKL